MPFKSIMTLPRLSLCTATVLLALSSLNAQSVTTAPVGAVSKTINVGLNSVGISLVNPNLVTANCTGNTSSVLTLNGVTNVGALLTGGLPYFVEAISGDLEGERFEVDTAATIAAANGTVVLNVGSANNTFALTGSEAINSQFSLRQHVTLAQVQSMFTTPLVANTNASNADQIRLFNTSTGAFVTYSLRTATQWVQGATASNNVAIPPGVGFLFRKVGSAATLVSTGGVRVNDFSMPMQTGLSFRALPYPISYTPTDLGGTTTNGWTGNNTASSADQIRIYNTATGAFVTNSLRSTNIWVQGATNVTSSPIMSYDEGFLLSRKTTDTDYILVAPAL